jgi:hypothetical protein
LWPRIPSRRGVWVAPPHTPALQRPRGGARRAAGGAWCMHPWACPFYAVETTYSLCRPPETQARAITMSLPKASLTCCDMSASGQRSETEPWTISKGLTMKRQARSWMPCCCRAKLAPGNAQRLRDEGGKPVIRYTGVAAHGNATHTASASSVPSDHLPSPRGPGGSGGGLREGRFRFRPRGPLFREVEAGDSLSYRWPP